MRNPALFCLTALLLVVPRAARADDVDVDKYMNGLQFKPEEVLAVKAGGQVSAIKEPPKETVDRQRAKLIVTVLEHRSLDKNFDDIAILDPSSNVIYPGALVKVNRLLVQGTPQALTVFNRNKDRTLKLNTDLPDLTKEEKSKFVLKPQAGSVLNAIEEMTSAWLNKHGSATDPERTKISARIHSKESFQQNEHQLMADLNLAVDASQGSVSSKLKLEKNSKSKAAVILFKQVFYTVSVDQPRDASDYLGKTASEELLRDNITAEEPPGYVHSVSYGRLLMVRIETSLDTTEGELKALVKYAKGGSSIEAKAQARYKNIVDKATVHMIAIGGDAEKAAEVHTTLEELPAAVKKFTRENANFTKSNRGLPIAYTVYFLGGRNGNKSNRNVLAKMSLHTNYTSEEITEYNEGLIAVDNKGAFAARVRLTYEEYRKEAGKWGWHEQTKQKGSLTVGTDFSQAIPPRSRNIQLVVDCETWLAWAPWRAVQGLESKTWDTPPRIRFTLRGATYAQAHADPIEGEPIK
jgi:thiol-activated cytolysin